MDTIPYKKARYNRKNTIYKNCGKALKIKLLLWINQL